MFQNNFATFLVVLRKSKNISQQELADKLYVDRSLISKWENGKLLPDVKYFDSICSIFDISITELLSCKIGSNEEKAVINYLKDNNKSKNIFKKSFIVTIIAFLCLFFIFLLFYFSTNYNQIKVYRIDCIYEKLEIKNGLLIVAGNDSYLKIGNIRSLDYDSFGEEISTIKLYLNDELIYEGASDKVINNIPKLRRNIDKLTIEINNEKYPVNLINVYSNKKIVYNT